MSYDLSDLKKVSDELLPHVKIGKADAARIAAACKNAPLPARIERRPAKGGSKRWLLYAAASCAACAAAVIFFFTAAFGDINLKPTLAADSEGNGQAAISADAGSLSDSDIQPMAIQLMTGFAAPEGARLAGSEPFAVMQGENGLYGVVDKDGEWVVGAEYDSGYIEDDDTACMTKDGKTVLLSLSEQLQNP